MNADRIFNSIAPGDVSGFLEAYNDTVDPRRTWTLCGRLSNPEKMHLRKMIRDVADMVATTILDLIDGDKDVTPIKVSGDLHPRYYDYLFTCQKCSAMHFTTWIHHSNPRFFKLINRYPWPIAGAMFSCVHLTRKTYVSTESMDFTFPAVAQILIAEVASGTSIAAIDSIWSLGRKDIWEFNSYRNLMSIASNDSVTEMHRIVMSHPNEFTLEDIRAMFMDVNHLISTLAIWNAFGDRLMICVNAGMSKIIHTIQSTRLCRSVGVALPMPSDAFSDVCIATPE